MKTVVLSLLLLVSASAFAERESSGKVSSYICDDGIVDGGHTISVSDMSEQKQFVVIMAKSRKGSEVIATDTLDLTGSLEQFRVYDNGVRDALIKLEVSAANPSNQKFAAVTYQTKIKSFRVPETGYLMCTRGSI